MKSSNLVSVIILWGIFPLSVLAESETFSILYPSALPTINYIDYIEVVFITPDQHPIVGANCENDYLNTAATFTSLGLYYQTLASLTCSISLYLNTTYATVSDTTVVGGTFYITSVAGKARSLYAIGSTANIDTTSSPASVETQPPSSSSTALSGSNHVVGGGLSNGAKVGIIVGSILGVAAVAGFITIIVLLLRRMKRSEKQLQDLQSQQHDPPHNNPGNNSGAQGDYTDSQALAQQSVFLSAPTSVSEAAKVYPIDRHEVENVARHEVEMTILRHEMEPTARHEMDPTPRYEMAPGYKR
ncbi:uncharacterized protein N7496_006839 [Penicillium cataractarum]|uniref:Mid2 domain-containing protein n=1 Tax=Penicillium cataractarum TaxID=2100454 RepID=A0A9W9S295_9EURO|nr:uncharacterized protein N7496_006839 [Penicillium cataractarum]KAJ5370747.1 hypothetical protein N7496_006839 [Penicillium cataractarum]